MLELNVGDRVRVEGLSQKGKNRIEEHGDEWTVRRIGSPPWQDGKVLFEAKCGYLRWQDPNRSTDWKIEKV